MDKFGRSIEVFNKPIKFWRDKSVGKKAIVIQKHVRGWMRVHYLLPNDVKFNPGFICFDPLHMTFALRYVGLQESEASKIKDLFCNTDTENC